MLTVKVIVSGGVIQHVEVPKGVEVIVHDYDVDGCEINPLQDEHGYSYIKSTWEAQS